MHNCVGFVIVSFVRGWCAGDENREEGCKEEEEEG